MNLTPWIMGWVVLTIVVIILAIYRWGIANHEDDSLHVSDTEVAVVGEQVAVAKKLAAVDRWGKILTAIALVYGLALAGAYLYKGWLETNGPTFS